MVDTWIILLHDIDYPHYYRSICADEAVDVIMKGSYSPFYNQNEHFMNGSLILDSEERVAFHRELLYRALQGERIILINNTGSPADLSNNFMTAMKVM